MGLFPITQPPGYSMVTSPNLPSIAPSNIREDRIPVTDSPATLSLDTCLASIIRVLPDLLTLHPIFVKSFCI